MKSSSVRKSICNVMSPLIYLFFVSLHIGRADVRRCLYFSFHHLHQLKVCRAFVADRGVLVSARQMTQFTFSFLGNNRFELLITFQMDSRCSMPFHGTGCVGCYAKGLTVVSSFILSSYFPRFCSR